MNGYYSTKLPPTKTGLMVDLNVVIEYCWAYAPRNKPITDANYTINDWTIDYVGGWVDKGATELGLYDYGNFYHVDSPIFWYYCSIGCFKGRMG